MNGENCAAAAASPMGRKQSRYQQSAVNPFKLKKKE